MPCQGSDARNRERLNRLSAHFLDRLHALSGRVYAAALASGTVRPDEVEAEIRRYYEKKRSGLQVVYSYYGEQWDYFYRLSAASDDDFLPMLQQARSAFARLYSSTDMDASYYMEGLKRYPRADIRWQRLRVHFMEKWERLLSEREHAYQIRHVNQLCEDYFRLISANADTLQNVAWADGGLSARLSWLQLTQSPELREKIRQLSGLIRNNPLIKELNKVLGREQADNQRLYRAVVGQADTTLCRRATHSDIVGVSEGNDLNALLPVEYCYLAEPALQPIFFRRYAEKKLAVFDSVSRVTLRAEASSRRGSDMQRRQQKGPFVVCVDTSGSMAGRREELSKAVVLSLALVADRLHRPCRVVFFSDQTQVVDLRDLYSGLPMLEAFLCGTFHGGTDLSAAMRDSLDALMREEFRYADLLWLSDFEMEPISPVWVQYVDELKQHGLRLYAVAFGDRPSQSYLDLADRVWRGV